MAEDPETPQGEAENPASASPDWLLKPTGEDVARYYPERAQRMNVEGMATISCTVDARGMLDNCSVVSEDPADQDFGSSALRMSKLFKMRPKTNGEGQPVDGGTVRIPIRFALPHG